MSGANDKVYPKDASLLALTGQIAVHFLDGDIIEGEFTTQDAYNIFVTVDNEPMMIPRHQIKFIKGKHVDQLAADNSQSSFGQAQPAPAATPSPQPEAEPAPQAEASAPVPAPVEESQPEDADEDDSTFVLSLDDIEEFAAMADETKEDDDDDDETFVLPPMAEETAVEADEEDDDATFILSADTGQPAAGQEDDDETFVLSSGTGELVVEDEDEEDDATFILPPGADQASIEEDEEDGTVVLDSGIDELDDTEKAAVMLEEDEDDATMVVSEREQLKEKAGITASLTCTSGPHSGQVFKVEGEMTTLGRSSDNDVPLSGDKEISRHHAVIAQESGKFVIQDQDSLNGTFVNNEQVTSPRYLENEDMILVGITTLKYKED